MDAATVSGFPWLTALVLLPLLGAVVLLLVPTRQHGVARGVALAWTSAIFVLSLGLLWVTDGAADGFELVEERAWLTALGASYRVGIDGISIWLVLLTTLLTPICILSTTHAITDRVKEFMVAFLVLQTGMIGALVALDMLLFYVFWEVMLIPMYLLIGIWGGDNRIAAAIKFVVYTLVGSLLMLAAIIYLHLQTPAPHSFSYEAMQAAAAGLKGTVQVPLFAAFALSFAIKVPFFPVHTWLPDAHTEAPTAGSVILAGVLLKMGTYGFLRFAMPFFPKALVVATPLLAALAVIGILYGALVAMVQTDIKKLVAYSSISHLGFVMLGLLALTPESVTGGVYQMLAHGVSTGGLFLAVGVIYERRHTRLISEFGGLAGIVPQFAVVFLIICLSSLGLPTMNGFVGEFLVLLGTFKSTMPGGQWAAGAGAVGVIFAAVYLLWMYQRVMFGPRTNPKNEGMADLSGREWLVFAPILALIFVMGLFPGIFLERIEPAVGRTIAVASATGARTATKRRTATADTATSTAKKLQARKPRRIRVKSGADGVKVRDLQQIVGRKNPTVDGSNIFKRLKPIDVGKLKAARGRGVKIERTPPGQAPSPAQAPRPVGGGN